MGELYKQLAMAELKSQLYRRGYRKAKASVAQTGTMTVPTTVTPVTAPIMTTQVPIMATPIAATAGPSMNPVVQLTRVKTEPSLTAPFTTVKQTINIPWGITNAQAYFASKSPVTAVAGATTTTMTTTATRTLKGGNSGKNFKQSKAALGSTGSRAKVKKTDACQPLETIPEVHPELESDPLIELDVSDTKAGDLCKILDDIPTEMEDEVEDSGIGTKFRLPKGYDPNAYLKEVNIKWPKQRQIEEVRVGSTVGATIPVQVGQIKCNALVDTGATRSCISEEFYQQLMQPQIRSLYQMTVVSATGSNVKPMGITTCEILTGKKKFRMDFIVCEKVGRPCYLGLDFLRKYKIGLGWSPTGKFQLQFKKETLVKSIDTHIIGPKILTKADIQIQPRTLMVLDVQIDLPQATPGLIYDVMPNLLMKDEHPNLVTIPLLHNIESLEAHCVPYMVVNLSQDGIFLPKEQMMGHLEPIPVSVEEITTESVYIGAKTPEEVINNETIPLEKKFITSPADVERHRKVVLEDAKVPEKYKQQFVKLCEEYNDIFSKGPEDIGKTPLITMEIDTGDSPPICQRPYNLPLKHADWVRKELEMLEKAGIISRSISPWASPIVIGQPEQPPKKRLCVDYRALNSLIPPVTKAHSKAKGVLTLVPLPKIDEIYARLRGSTIYSALDMTSGYHHMELSEEAKLKSAFVTTIDKYEFNRCPFGLAQAPAYFQ